MRTKSGAFQSRGTASFPNFFAGSLFAAAGKHLVIAARYGKFSNHSNYTLETV
jgi:hypothetical protein